MKNVGLVGIGLIGGSMVMDLKSRGYASQILGVEKRVVNAEAALRLGLVDRVVSLEECVEQSDVIIVSVPVSSAYDIISRALETVQRIGGTEKVVLDVCSTKWKLAERLKYHPCRKCFVSTHPMAGTEYSGPWAAQPGLFDGRACIIADVQESAPEAVREVESLYSILNMRIVYMNSDAHDVHTAYISHLSHVTSFALALTVLEKEKDEKHIFDLASGGFSSTVRLAKSGPEMWAPIFSQNRDNLLHVIDEYMNNVQRIRDAIEDDDLDSIANLIAEANRIKRILR